MASEVCSAGAAGNSCTLSARELGEYDAVAGTRMITSCLSLIGTLTIIILAVGKRQVFKSKIHPIFVLALADFILACLWIVGAGIWYRRNYPVDRIWCLVVSLSTIIFLCITINLTLIYAILAYQAMKKADLDVNQSLLNRERVILPLEKVWRSSITIGVYAIACVAPVVLVLLLFGIVIATSKDFIRKMKECSCWCLPHYINVMPSAVAIDKPTATYNYYIAKLLIAYSSLIGFHYLVVFVLLVVIYYKLLKYIKRLRQDYEATHKAYRYGVIITSIIESQSQAKTRVLLFLIIFIINGSFNFLLSLGLIVYEAYRLPHGARVKPTPNSPTWGHTTLIVILILQSVTLPMQGFFNALVYGWTRREFVQNMALMPKDLREESSDHRIPNQMVNQTKKTFRSSLLHSRNVESSRDGDQSTEVDEALTDIDA